MQVRTSVTLSPDTAQALDELGGNRSRHVEAALVVYLRDIRRARRDALDREIIEASAEDLNAELDEFLQLQEPM